MNFYQQLGTLVFGTRLKKLSDYFLSEINKVYSDQNIPFEASWFGVFFLVRMHSKTKKAKRFAEKGRSALLHFQQIVTSIFIYSALLQSHLIVQ